ncbi:MAG: glycosyltransferase [Verrucomicrobia bacterium]|nr:MAG: glycosyltransferase [Verrucomicrobiota bacterium]
MRLVQLTPGAGRMYCGNCLRDNALVRAWQRQGHQALLVPLYLPLTLDEEDLSGESPIFFSGLNVYLDQKLPWFRRAPEWLRRWFRGRRLLGWVGARAARTRAEEVGDMTISMLLGPEGNQARDLQELVDWLAGQPRADGFFLSNALLLGLAPGLKRAFDSPVFAFLAGEDSFVDAMPEPARSEVWRLMARRAREVDRFLAPSRYFAERMQARLDLPADKVAVAPTGISLEGYPATPAPAPRPPVIGYLARMCEAKGLPLLVDAFIELRRRGRVPGVRLAVAGSCGPTDEPVVAAQRAKLESAGLQDAVTFRPNLPREEKIRFLRGLTLFSVPATYGEAFGLYLVEAMAAGVPVVQPPEAAFPELIEATGGGLLARETTPTALAEAWEELLSDPARRDQLARQGQQAVHANYKDEGAARRILELCGLANPAPSPASGRESAEPRQVA